jgi:hypothetical protein
VSASLFSVVYLRDAPVRLFGFRKVIYITSSAFARIAVTEPRHSHRVDAVSRGAAAYYGVRFGYSTAASRVPPSPAVATARSREESIQDPHNPDQTHSAIWSTLCLATQR